MSGRILTIAISCVAAVAAAVVLATQDDLGQTVCSGVELSLGSDATQPPKQIKTELINDQSSEQPAGVPDVSHLFPLRRLAFGSCFKQETERMSQRAREVLRGKQIAVLKTILSKEPDAWIWIGDAGYSEGPDVASLRKAFEGVLSLPLYRKLLQDVQVVSGVWDDHDFGMNDGGSNQRNKAELQTAFLDFLSVPSLSPRRRRNGVYVSHSFSLPGAKEGVEGVRLIMLDTRTHRSNHYIPSVAMYHSDTFNHILSIAAAGSRALAHFFGLGASYDGDILGEEQWQWLEEQLRHSKAQVNILVSSIQISTGFPIVESWGHFPRALRRLKCLLADVKPRGLVLLSGDVHFAEIRGSKEGVLEYTSSGMTHTLAESPFHRNLMVPLLENMFSQGRVSPVAFSTNRNFGLLEIRYSEHPGGAVDVRGEIIDADSGEVILEASQSFVSSTTGEIHGAWRGNSSFSEWPEVVRELSVFELLLRVAMLAILVILCTWPFLVLMRSVCLRRKKFGYSVVPAQIDSTQQEVLSTSPTRTNFRDASLHG